MAHKDFRLADGLAVTVYKRRGNRNVRLSVSVDGNVRVSIPAWAPYRVGVQFAGTRQAWIRAQQTTPAPLSHGQAVGKGHHVLFVARPELRKPTSRLRASEIVVGYPAGMDPAGAAVQQVAREAGVRSLRRQAEQLLPQRLASLAARYGFTYRDVRIKRLQSRWGSCDHERRIVLNLFLMQLPWELIDYVLLHELTHTRVLRHGPDFWRAMGDVSPRAKALQKQLREYRPALAAG